MTQIVKIHPEGVGMTDQPAGYCPKCDYRINPGVCPECGFDCSPKKLRRRPRLWAERHKVKSVLALVLVGVGGWTMFTQTSITPYLPNWYLLLRQGWDDKYTGEAAYELGVRYFQGRFTADESTRFFRQLGDTVWYPLPIDESASAVDCTQSDAVEHLMKSTSTGGSGDAAKRWSKVLQRFGCIVDSEFKKRIYLTNSFFSRFDIDATIVSLRLDGKIVPTVPTAEWIDYEEGDRLFSFVNSTHPAMTFAGWVGESDKHLWIRGCTPGSHETEIETQTKVIDKALGEIVAQWRSTMSVNVDCEKFEFVNIDIIDPWLETEDQLTARPASELEYFIVNQELQFCEVMTIGDQTSSNWKP